MKIDIYAAGYCHDVGKDTQRSGASVILYCVDDEHREAKRVISHPTGLAAKNYAEISAMTLGLASVVKKYRKDAIVTLHVPKHLVGFLEKSGDEYKKNSNAYKDELGKLRQWAGFYNNLNIQPAQKKGVLKDCLAEAKVCADNQKPKDTRTQHVES